MGSGHRQRVSLIGHCRWRWWRPADIHVSTFLRPFAPRPLQALQHYYGRSDSYTALRTVQVSVLHAHGQVVTIPSPTTRCCVVAPLTRSHQAHDSPAVPWIPPGWLACLEVFTPSGAGQASHITSSLAETSGRNEFVILRTGHSPTVALHPASRRRSYRRLQTGERMSGQVSHLPNRVRSHAH